MQRIIYLAYSVLLILICLLSVEYYFFLQHKEQFLIMQQEYQEYLGYYKQAIDCIKEVPDLCAMPDTAGDCSSCGQEESSIIPVMLPQEPQKKIQEKPARFAWPIDRSQFWLSSHFGVRKMKHRKPSFHYGIDMAALKGTLVRAAQKGIVTQAGISTQGYGNCIIIQHEKGIKTRYAHLHSIMVKVGDAVAKGQKIGRVGNTGFVRASKGDAQNATHLHFEVIEYGKHRNPLLFLK